MQHQYLGTQGFLQSRLERLDQIVGQMGDKAHGVSQYNRTDTLPATRRNVGSRVANN